MRDPDRKAGWLGRPFMSAAGEAVCVRLSVWWPLALMQWIIPGPLESYELTYLKIYIDAYKLYPSKTDPEFNLEHIGRKWSPINCVWNTVPCNPTRRRSWILAQHRWAVSPDETLLRSEMHLRTSKRLGRRSVGCAHWSAKDLNRSKSSWIVLCEMNTREEANSSVMLCFTAT